MKVNSKSSIIGLLKKSNTPVSGEEISRDLGISRTAVWKNIKKLSEEGYSIKSSHSGYLLAQEEDLLLPYEFLEESSLYIYKEHTNSTMDCARELIYKNRARSGNIVVAESQVSGIGKNEGQFISPKGGLYFTIILYPDCPISETNLYPMAAVMAVEKSIMEIMHLETSIKWPFETWFNNRKISGVLHEYGVRGYRCQWLTLGIGINPDFPIPRQKLLADIKRRVLTILEEPEKILSKYINSLGILYSKHTFTIEGKTIEGCVTGIDQLGTLQISDDSGTKYGYIGNSTQED